MTSIKNTQTNNLDTAEAEAHAADQQEANLERRVLEGDPDVTAHELGTAAAGSRFARLRATAAKNRKAKAERDAQTDRENSVRDEWAKIKKDGTAAAARNREAAAQLEQDITAAVERFAATLTDRRAVADGLMAKARAAGAQTHQIGNRATPRAPIHIETRVSGDILMIDGTMTATTDEAAGIDLRAALKRTITATAAGVHVSGRPLGNW